MAAGLVGQIGVNRIFEWSTLQPKRQVIGQPNKVLRPELHPYFGGNGTITGTIKVGTIAVKRRVRLYDATTGILIREQWSNDDGAYSFTGMKKGINYTVTATDTTDTYNDVIAARVTAL